MATLHDSYSMSLILIVFHSIIQIDNNVQWDSYYSTEHSSHSIGMWGIFCKVLSVSQSVVMDLKKITLVDIDHKPPVWCCIR